MPWADVGTRRKLPCARQRDGLCSVEPSAIIGVVAQRDVLAEVLALPMEERARIVRELLRSLDAEEDGDPATIERAWTEEITRRIDEVEAGNAAAEDWPTVRDQLRAGLNARRAGR